MDLLDKKKEQYWFILPQQQRQLNKYDKPSSKYLTLLEAELTAAHGFLVYKIKVVDQNMKKYKVIVDPGNGQVLMKKEITWCDYEHEKMKYGEEKYGKYGHDDQYDTDKNMMMKDKKY